MKSSKITKRSWHLLKLIIEQYIRDGLPVASKTVAKKSNLRLSPATIRYIMADLEDLGYLSSLHTSSGRIPTAQGYRLFVNDLLISRSITMDCSNQWQTEFNLTENTDELLQKASLLLSDLTELAGVVTTPKPDGTNIRHVEFLALSNNRILAILVFNKHEVQNRIIYTDRSYSESELQQAANFINECYGGKNLLTIRSQLVESMKDDKQTMSDLMQAALDMANKVFQNDDQQPKDCVMAGQSNLLNLTDTTSIDSLKKIFEIFTQKQTVLHLLDKCLCTDGIQIFIGQESGYDMFEDLSIVTAPYKASNTIIGALGVIGPTRMPYSKVISAVDITSRLLSMALGGL